MDTTIAGVPIQEVLFDTFGRGYIPLSVATEEVIDALRDAIKPIYEPRYDEVSKGNWMSDDYLLIGYVPGKGPAFAYSIKILNLHEIVNDEIDGVPLLVSYCPLCASAVVYERELEGTTLLFGNTSALYDSDPGYVRPPDGQLLAPGHRQGDSRAPYGIGAPATALSNDLMGRVEGASSGYPSPQPRPRAAVRAREPRTIETPTSATPTGSTVAAPARSVRTSSMACSARERW
ncbi:MAG: DUF3179 domain-containing (seleno)protein [Chloroflexi bacterium]|nr:DUF3179 domain-containing (seleno)protein [Chloroflexota bacterium]